MKVIPVEWKSYATRLDFYLISIGTTLVGVGLVIPLVTGMLWLLGVPSLPDSFRFFPVLTFLSLGCGGLIAYIAFARISGRYEKDQPPQNEL